MKLKEGELFHGRYSIISLLGEGSVGAVYRARQIDSGREVALKLLLAGGHETQKERERFLREFRILAQLSHEHIVSFFGAAISTDGFPYAVFEFIDGSDLHHAIESEKRLSFARTIKIAEQVCQAMQYAHDQGVIHRDLKPENIMLLAEPRPDFVKILDFGFARRDSTASHPTQKLTATGMVVGTVCYLSPEQCKGGQAGVHSDIYALACIIYECLAGKLLFEAETPLAVVQKQIYEEPAPALKQLQALVPERFIPVLKKALNKDPSRRQQSMAEFREDLLSLPQDVGATQAAARAKTKKLALAAGLVLLAMSGTFAACIYYHFQYGKDADSVFAPLPAQSSSNFRLLAAQTPGKLLNDAAELLEKHDYAGAELRLRLALEKALRGGVADDTFRAQLLLARVSLLSGDINASRQRAENTVATAGKYFSKTSIQYFKALSVLGEVYRITNPPRARAIFQDLLKEWAGGNKTADPYFIELLSNYIDLLQAAGLNRTAEQELEKYKSYFVSADVQPYVSIKYLCLQAGVKYSLARKKEADNYTSVGLELTYKSAKLGTFQKIKLLVLWSHMFFRYGEKEKAIELLREAQKLSSAERARYLQVSLYTDESNMLQALYNYGQALIALEKAGGLIHPGSEPSQSITLSSILYEKAVCHMKLSSPGRALDCLREAMSVCPADATAIFTKCADLKKHIEQEMARNKEEAAKQCDN